jgi:hypothetical protein
MPSLVTTGFIQKERHPMMVFVDNGESGDDHLSFSDLSYNTEGEQEDEEVSSVENEKENKQQPNTSHLRLPVLVSLNQKIQLER